MPAFAPIPLGASLLPNSVAVHDGVVAVALQADPKTDPGVVKFFDTDGTFLNQVTVGALPDMLVFSHNGRWLLVANEGEPSSYRCQARWTTIPKDRLASLTCAAALCFFPKTM